MFSKDHYSLGKVSHRNFDQRSALKYSWMSRSNGNFWFLFWIVTRVAFYNLTENLSKSLQSKNLSTLSNHRLTLLTRDTLVQYEMWWEFSELLSYHCVKSCRASTDWTNLFNQKSWRPKYSILLYIEGHKSTKDHHPLTPEDHYRTIYYEAADAIIQTIMTQFE